MSQETILLGLMLITFLGLVAGLKWPVVTRAVRRWCGRRDG